MELSNTTGILTNTNAFLEMLQNEKENDGSILYVDKQKETK